MYPFKNNSIFIDYGNIIFKNTFDSSNRMKFVQVAGNQIGKTDIVTYNFQEIHRNIFMLWWDEPHTGDYVTQIQNLNNMTVYTNIYNFTNRNVPPLIHLSGNIKQSSFF